MENTYPLHISGLTRELRYFPLGNGQYIAGFIMFGDIELTEHCAEELLKLCPPYDVLITAESKGIPLVYEMAKRRGDGTYVVARKQQKLYMSDAISVDVKSITTAVNQKLYLDRTDVLCIRNKRVLIVDDVISTGNTVAAVAQLVEKAGGIVAGYASVLAEGDAIGRDDLTYLAPLPIFNEEDVRGKK